MRDGITRLTSEDLVNSSSTPYYSPQLASDARMTAMSGSTVASLTNSSGTYLSLGNTTARMIRSDMLTNSGVVHVVDGLLMTTQQQNISSAFVSTDEDDGVTEVHGAASAIRASAFVSFATIIASIYLL